MMNLVGFDVKKAAKLIGAAAKKNRVYVMRDEENVLTITDGVLILRGTEQNVWDIVKALPSPVPADADTYIYRSGNAAEKAPASLASTINDAIRQATRGIEDTFITVHQNGFDMRILVPCSGQGEYAAIQDKFHEVFATSNTVYRQGNEGGSSIVVYHAQTNEVVGALMPMRTNAWSCAFLRPLPSESTESAAD